MKPLRSLALGLVAAAAVFAFAHFTSEAKAGLGLSLVGVLAIGTVNARTLRDVNLFRTAALPAAAATSYTASIDTANVNPGRVPNVELIVELPATPSLVDAKTITLAVQDSADNITFAAVADIPAQVATGAGGVGAAALAYQCKLPIGLRRYVRLGSTVLAAGGDNTAISASIGFIF